MSVSGLHMCLHVCEYGYTHTCTPNTVSGNNVRMVKSIQLAVHPCFDCVWSFFLIALKVNLTAAHKNSSLCCIDTLTPCFWGKEAISYRLLHLKFSDMDFDRRKIGSNMRLFLKIISTLKRQILFLKIRSTHDLRSFSNVLNSYSIWNEV